MPIVLGLDLETTGLLTATDRIIELGTVLWDTDTNKSLLLKNDLMWNSDYPTITEEINRVTGITQADLEAYGNPSAQTLSQLLELGRRYKPERIVAHNGENFDKPLLIAELNRHGFTETFVHSTPWVDTKTDLPFETPPRSNHLGHLAYDMGFINPFPHRALSDVLTMLKVMSQFKFEDILAHAAIPWVTVRAVVPFDDKQKAKDRRYSWEKIGEKSFPKMWVKRIKVNKLEEEVEALKPYQVVRVE